ncbi:NTP transferase domain-containing protein [Paenibacillus monticola]|uniref:NTP transferase domain-containing protein n=1 Tax=Paenibacillus monticola TaxID=2666075 RepID=A0A7X2L0D7_9BACL|nr:NTP transferase domain-containing protein [Paenibacillus monticola]MRN52028.1 NTP transferase domain-containing protein [Paenibacillus monticola]
MKIAGIYLAAGQNRRTRESKVSLQLSQEASLRSVILSELDRCNLEPLIVVVRADDTLAWLPPTASDMGARRIETCLTAHLGLSFSLRCGLNAVLPMQPDGVVVVRADQPFITTSLVNQLIETFEHSPELDFVASSNQGSGMPPTLFSSALFPVLQGLDGDNGAVGILHSPDYKGITLEANSNHSFMDADLQRQFSETCEEGNLRNWK